MAESQHKGHWKRRILPSRSKTPSTSVERSKMPVTHIDAVSIRSSFTEPGRLFSTTLEANNFSTESIALRKLLPDVDRMRTRSRLSSYINDHLHTGSSSQSHRSRAQSFDWSSIEPDNEPYSLPDIELVMNSLLQRLTSSPHLGLGPENNYKVSQLLEAYRDLHVDVELVKCQLLREQEKQQTAEVEFLKAKHEWADQEEAYKADIKRLEVLIANGQTGLHKVTQSRSLSVVKRNRSSYLPTLQGRDRNITEFQCPENGRGLQTTRQSIVSQMHQNMVRMSRHFASEDTEMTAALESTSPPRLGSMELSPILSRLLDPFGDELEPQTAAEVSNGSASSDLYSSFSSTGGDLLPDEEEAERFFREHGLDVEEIASLQVTVGLIAAQRNISSEDAVTKLAKFIQANPVYVAEGAAHLRIAKSNLRDITMSTSPHREVNLTRTAPSSESRSRGHKRVFSFQAGDDTAGHFSTVSDEAHDSSSTQRVQCYSPPLATRANSEPTRSEMSSSPDCGQAFAPIVGHCHCETRRSSLIPAPSRESSLARPRREDSSCSYRTAIMRSPMRLNSTASQTSSRQSSTSRFIDTPNPSGKMGPNHSAMLASRAHGPDTSGGPRYRDHEARAASPRALPKVLPPPPAPPRHGPQDNCGRSEAGVTGFDAVISTGPMARKENQLPNPIRNRSEGPSRDPNAL